MSSFEIDQRQRWNQCMTAVPAMRQCSRQARSQIIALAERNFAIIQELQEAQRAVEEATLQKWMPEWLTRARHRVFS